MAERVSDIADIDRIEALGSRHDVEHGGLRVCWRRFGDSDRRPPLVLLHGGHGSWMHWLRNIEALSAGRTLWLPDMPGYHDSDAPARVPPGQDALAPLLAPLIGSLDALVGAHTAIDLGGFSFGGFVATRLAVQRGGIRRLALMGSAGHGTLRRMSVQMVDWRRGDGPDAVRAALRHNLAALMLHDEAAIDALALEIHDRSCQGTRFRSKGISLAGGLQAALGAIATPQLLVWGEHDVTADSRPLVAQLVAGHPNRQGVVVDGAGHWVQHERADEVNGLLLRFFGATG